MKYNDYVIKDALSSDTRKMQIKTLNFLSSQSGWLSLEKEAMLNIGECVEERELLHTADGTINLCHHPGNKHGGSSKT